MDITTILLASSIILLVILIVLSGFAFSKTKKPNDKKVKTDLKRIKEQINGEKRIKQL